MPGDFRHPRDTTTHSTFPQAPYSHGPHFKICFCESPRLSVKFKGPLYRHTGQKAMGKWEHSISRELQRGVSYSLCTWHICPGKVSSPQNRKYESWTQVQVNRKCGWRGSEQQGQLLLQRPDRRWERGCGRQRTHQNIKPEGKGKSEIMKGLGKRCFITSVLRVKLYPLQIHTLKL